jgi:hypothetical protein
MNTRILITAIHGPYQPWLQILSEGQLRTWMSPKSGIRIINVFGEKIKPKHQELDQKIYYLRWSKNKAVAYLSLLLEAVFKIVFLTNRYRPNVVVKTDQEFGNVWMIQMPDLLVLQGVKNMAVFRESLKHDFDYLVTTITSTYLNLQLLENYLAAKPKISFVGGRIERSGSMLYPQGSFRVYSRDVVEYIVNNSKKYKHWKIEDIAMGNLVNKAYRNFENIPNLTLDSTASLVDLTSQDYESVISYRCKSMNGNKRMDAPIMHLLHRNILLNQSND